MATVRPVRRVSAGVADQGSSVVNAASNYVGQAATNGVIANTSQGAVAVANLTDLNGLKVTVTAVIDALKAHGLINTA